MTGGKKIVGIWRDQASGTGDSDPLSANEPALGEDASRPRADDAASASSQWAADSFEPAIDGLGAPVFADDHDAQVSLPKYRFADRFGRPLILLAGTAWTAFVAWQVTSGFAIAPTADDLSAAGLSISGPLALLGIVWLGIARSSTAELDRYARATATLRAESDALAQRVVALNGHLHDAQSLLADQSQQISKLGLEAATRLHDSAASLGTTMAQCVNASEQVAQHGEQARKQIDGLLAGLPKVDAVAQRMADNIRHAGLVAHQHGANLEAQLAAVSEQGASAAHMAEQAVARLHDVILTTKQESIAAKGALQELGADLQRISASSLAANGQVIDAAQSKTQTMLADMASGVERHSARLSQLIADAIGALNSGLDAANTSAMGLGEQIGRHETRATALGQQLLADQDRLAAGIESLETRTLDSFARLTSGLEALDHGLARLTPALAAGKSDTDALIRHNETLLLSIESIARELDESLPRAFARLDERAVQSQAVLDALSPALDSGEAQADVIMARLQSAYALAQRQGDALVQTAQTTGALLESQSATAAELERKIRIFGAEAEAFAEGGGPKMVASLLQVRETAMQAATRAREALDDVVRDAASAMAESSATALSGTLRASVQEQLDAIAAASDRAVAAAQAATDRLMRQMITIMDTSSAIESRVAEAEEKLGAAAHDGMARRVALLTESLKSAAIDVSKFLSAEISDTAWQNYLKGDRGVFTRRAVKLVEASDSKDILRLYEQDDAFRGHVNQYIHDFESMLRGILGTRDGTALSVTLLSSDVGKLYVALAQAIDRLRG